jgi:hypothetical protein
MVHVTRIWSGNWEKVGTPQGGSVVKAKSDEFGLNCGNKPLQGRGGRVTFQTPFFRKPEFDGDAKDRMPRQQQGRRGLPWQTLQRPRQMSAVISRVPSVPDEAVFPGYPRSSRRDSSPSPVVRQSGLGTGGILRARRIPVRKAGARYQTSRRWRALDCAHRDMIKQGSLALPCISVAAWDDACILVRR